MKLGRQAAFAAVVAIGGLTSGAASAASPGEPPATTTTTTTAATDTTTATSTTVAPGVVAGPTPPRGGSAAGGLVHDTGQTELDLRSIATSALLGLVALAVAGHLYGRMQSTTPRVGPSIADRPPPR